MIEQKQIRGFPSMTRAALNAAAQANQLNPDKIYLISDESNRIAVAITSSTFSEFLKVGDTAANEIMLVASGTINNNVTVALRSDGKVEAINKIGIAANMGAEVQASSVATNGKTACCYDSINKKVIVVCTSVTTNLGYVVVGTISDSSISFGSPIYFTASAIDNISAAFDPDTGHVVIAYRQTSNNYGYAVVGTVSGTTISFGTAVNFLAGTVNFLTAVYATVAKKIIITYKALANSYIQGVIGTITGNSISFSSPSTINAVSTFTCTSCYDPSSDRIITAVYDAAGTAAYSYISSITSTALTTTAGAMIANGSPIQLSIDFLPDINKIAITYYTNNTYIMIGAISGNSITYGSPVVANPLGGAIYTARCTYLIGEQKLLVYGLGGAGVRGSYSLGTVSGNAITMGNPINISSTRTSDYPSMLTTGSEVAFVYSESATGNVAKSAIFKDSRIYTNAAKFFGFSSNAAADGQAVTVKLGNSKIGGFSGLTPALPVYTNDSGMISHSNTTYPKVGVALSATEILVANNSI